MSFGSTPNVIYRRIVCRYQVRVATSPESSVNNPTDLGLPPLFVERLRRILPADRVDGCLDTFTLRPHAVTFRVNVLTATVDAVLEELADEGFEVATMVWPEEAYFVPGHQRSALTHCDACTQGRIYVQNPSSMIPPVILDPQPTDWILDLAAAPGGKTTHLAALMGNAGRISAVESVKGRFHRMRANLERCGVRNVSTYLKDGTKVYRQCPEQFDRVLLDAPCSSEGRFDVQDPASHAYWSLKKIREMNRKQRRLIYSAVRCLKPGGVLVYSTCTFAPEENEAVIDRVLEQFGSALEVESIALPATAGNLSCGVTQWGKAEFDPRVEHGTRILPDGVMEGFFVAKLIKCESTED
jgi:NOL1/NOP2/sun family putative RNA methylase